MSLGLWTLTWIWWRNILPVLPTLVALFYTVLTYKVAYLHILHPKLFFKCSYSFWFVEEANHLYIKKMIRRRVQYDIQNAKTSGHFASVCTISLIHTRWDWDNNYNRGKKSGLLLETNWECTWGAWSLMGSIRIEGEFFMILNETFSLRGSVLPPKHDSLVCYWP